MKKFEGATSGEYVMINQALKTRFLNSPVVYRATKCDIILWSEFSLWRSYAATNSVCCNDLPLHSGFQ